MLGTQFPTGRDDWLLALVEHTKCKAPSSRLVEMTGYWPSWSMPNVGSVIYSSGTGNPTGFASNPQGGVPSVLSQAEYHTALNQ